MDSEIAKPAVDATTATRATSHSSSIYSLVLIGIVLAPFILGGAYYILTRPDLPGVAAWLQTQNLAVGEHEGVVLPAQFQPSTDNGTIDVVVLPSGRICFLLKTNIGWKQNYEGYVYSTEPLRQVEFYSDYYGRTCILFSEHVHPVVERKIDDQTYAVFFDLG